MEIVFDVPIYPENENGAENEAENQAETNPPSAEFGAAEEVEEWVELPNIDPDPDSDYSVIEDVFVVAEGSDVNSEN